jgi:S-layer protein (TIGR01564 family)
MINVTMGWTSGGSSEVEAANYTSTNTDAASTEIGDTDVFRDFTYSALATEILLTNPSSGENSITLTYHGDEVTADVYITSPETVVTTTGGSTTGTLGNVVVRDSEVDSVSSKNLIVVGGSCINSVAARLVGGARCGSSWTTATGVGSGQFLIQSFADAYTEGRIALLVAGYDAADTTNAATYLTTRTVDTAEGKKYIGTTETSAELQVD